MKTATELDIEKLQKKIAKGVADDAVARCTDAAKHLRLAMDILTGAASLTPDMAEAATLMLRAADRLVGKRVT